MEETKDLSKVLEEAGRAREENSFIGKLLDEGVSALEREFSSSEPVSDFPIELERTLYEKTVGILTEISQMQNPSGAAVSEMELGILLSAIISNQNGYYLDRLDIWEHDPAAIKSIKKLLSHDYCIDDGAELMERAMYYYDGDYVKRFLRYASAGDCAELYDDDMDELDRQSENRAWRFVKTFENSLNGDAFLGWDLCRGAMLVRWGSFCGYITRKQADDYLIMAARKIKSSITGFRALAQSYVLGALFYKLICGETDAQEYLDRIFDSICELIRGDEADGIGQWRRTFT